MNFVDCHQERIHVPGYIQDFGYLIGLDAHSQTIKFYSQNISELFDLDVGFFGKKLQELPDILGALLSSVVVTNLDMSTLKEADMFLDKVEIDDELFHLTIYRIGETVLLEFEKILEQYHHRSFISKKYETIHNAVDAQEIWNELICSVADTTDYDRVMLYRFLPDGSGKVIAEKIKNNAESFLNLHYPESDIPQQARALYLKKRKRIFSNVHSAPVPIISNIDAEIDLTYSTLRAMSPVHGQYLKNAGASSAFSTSIIINNKLWGMVTCQNIEPKHIDLTNRIRAEVFTVIGANAYSSYKSGQILEESVELDRKMVALKKKLMLFDNVEDSLFSNVEELKDYPEADGLAVIVGQNIRTAGVVPSDENILKIVKWAGENSLKNFYASNEFSSVHQGNLGNIENAAGVMFGFTDENRTELLIWFRKEINSQVLWAGNPAKNADGTIMNGEENLTISPRKSFQTYIENIKNKALPWKTKDVFAAKKVMAMILETTYSQFRRVQELNDELRNLNEELDSFSYTISHDLGTPLTVMKLNAQLLEKSQHDNPEVQKRIYSILQEIIGMETMMRGVLNLSRAKSSEIVMKELETKNIIEKICYDAKLTINENTEIEIQNLPNVLADQVMLTQVFLNVISNAVKYSANSETPKVYINGVEHGDYVVYKVKDNGIGIPQEAHDKMFKIFSRMHNAKAFTGTGVGLAIVYRIMERLEGKISYESKLDQGTTMILTFKKPGTTA